MLRDFVVHYSLNVSNSSRSFIKLFHFMLTITCNNTDSSRDVYVVDSKLHAKMKSQTHWVRHVQSNANSQTLDQPNIIS